MVAANKIRCEGQLCNYGMYSRTMNSLGDEGWLSR
jgi:hypothetical protein